MEGGDQSIEKKFQLAFRLQQQNKNDKALRIYQEILAQDGTHHDALVNLAALLRKTGRVDTALQLLVRAEELHPNSIIVRFNLGNMYYTSGHYQHAVACYRKCVSMADRMTGFHARFAEALRNTGELTESITHYRKACKAAPENLTLANNFAELLIRLEKFDDALPLLERMISLYPNVMAPRGNLANLNYRANRIQDAIRHYHDALKIEPGSSELHKGLGVAYHKALEPELAEDHLNRSISLGVSDSRVHSNLLYLQSYREDRSSASVYEMHKKWGQAIEAKLAESDFNHHDYTIARPLKIGIISPDMHDHPVAHFMLPFYKNISKTQLNVYTYSDGRKFDSYSRQIKSYSYQWREVSKLSDCQLAEQVIRDQIDIAIDLAGHSSTNRIECFARRIAPVQISYLGYVNTTGLSRIGYRICDSMVNPPETQCYYTETLLPIKCFSCYYVPDHLPEVSEGPALRNGYITFGSVNNASKLSPHCISIWSKILKQVEGSKLLLKAGQFTDEWVREKIHQRFASQNIGPDRLIFEEPSTPKDSFLTSLNAIDLLLDPFPHNGGTTTHDALSMGVASVCLNGDVYVKRFGYQIMKLSGNESFIASSPEEYIGIAVRFAACGGESRAVRLSRRDRFLQSSLTDSGSFVSDLDKTLREVWKKKCLQSV